MNYPSKPKMTINQLIDRIDSMNIADLTPEIAETRQKLLDIKGTHINVSKAGLTLVENTSQILETIRNAEGSME